MNFVLLTLGILAFLALLAILLVIWMIAAAARLKSPLHSSPNTEPIPAQHFATPKSQPDSQNGRSAALPYEFR